MRETQVTMPELGLIALTRVALGAGLGLLVADLLVEPQRKAVGWTLLAFGVMTTVPLAYEVLGRQPSLGTADRPERLTSGGRLSEPQFSR